MVLPDFVAFAPASQRPPALPNPYADASVGPMSPQQKKGASGVLGPLLRPVVTKNEDTDDTPRPPSLPRPEVFRYPAELPPLTAEQQALLASRRRAATRQFEETQANVARGRARAEAEALRAQTEIARQQALQSRAGMQTLAGRGVGRSPMFVNPFQRELVTQSQRAVGQLQSGLADTLAQLEGALRQADIGRESELAQIDFDATSMRSDVARLLGG